MGWGAGAGAAGPPTFETTGRLGRRALGEIVVSLGAALASAVGVAVAGRAGVTVAAVQGVVTTTVATAAGVLPTDDAAAGGWMTTFGSSCWPEERVSKRTSPATPSNAPTATLANATVRPREGLPTPTSIAADPRVPLVTNELPPPEPELGPGLDPTPLRDPAPGFDPMPLRDPTPGLDRPLREPPGPAAGSL